METNRNAQVEPLAKTRAIKNWVQKNAIPIQYVGPGNGFEDLQPLKQILRDVKLVGLGEATHGTQEFFQFKHRLLEFLVMEMGFTDFTIESSTAAGVAIEAYIQTGSGDMNSALSNQGFIAWDTEEFTDMLLWMRSYNEQAPEEKKIHFHGVDNWRNDLNRAKVIDYLGRVAPDKMAGSVLLFDSLANEEKKWPFKIDDGAQKTMVQLYFSLIGLIDDFTTNRDQYIRRSSDTEFDQMQHSLEVMRQWLIANADELRAYVPTEYHPRSQFMAENLIHVIECGKPDAKYIYWAHNWHVSKGDHRPAENRAGYCLRQKFGEQYYALGLLTCQGTFQSRAEKPDQSSDYLKQVLLPPVPEGSFAWHLSRVQTDNFLINFRAPVQDSMIMDWLCTRQVAPKGDWFTSNEDQFFALINFYEDFDGVAFFNRTNAVHPTRDAVEHCEIGIGGFF